MKTIVEYEMQDEEAKVTITKKGYRIECEVLKWTHEDGDEDLETIDNETIVKVVRLDKFGSVRSLFFVVWQVEQREYEGIPEVQQAIEDSKKYLEEYDLEYWIQVHCE